MNCLTVLFSYWIDVAGVVELQCLKYFLEEADKEGSLLNLASEQQNSF